MEFVERPWIGSGVTCLTGNNLLMLMETNLVLKIFHVVYHKDPCWAHCFSYFTLMISLIHPACYLSSYSLMTQTYFFHIDRDPQILLDTVNNELEFVQDLIYANKLSLNIAKTQYMVFKNNQTRSLPGHITINNVNLKQTECTKFLGLYIDNDLSWKSHINHLCKLLSRNTGILYKLKDFFPINILQTLYGTLINSYIYYGILAWGNSTSSLLDRILHIQKRAIRIVNRKPLLAHTNELFLSNKVFKITDLFLFNVGVFMYKLSLNDLPDVFSTLFMRNDAFHTYPTRQSHSYHLPRTRTVFAQKTIKYNGPKFWNELPCEIITSPSLYVFKKNLKSFLLQKYSTSNHV